MDTMLALYTNSRKMGSENVLYNPFRIHEGGAAPCLPRALGLGYYLGIKLHGIVSLILMISFKNLVIP